ncbi:hypothetical protein [Xanthomonas nasturtii]|uniref:hypothetical protein n=1 Tax=Xanthomonas nasturtii TaxID=1843581 RepID=UPI003D2F6C30
MPSAVQLASSERLITQTREIGPLTLLHMQVHLSVAEQLHRAAAMLAHHSIQHVGRDLRQQATACSIARLRNVCSASGRMRSEAMAEVCHALLPVLIASAASVVPLARFLLLAAPSPLMRWVVTGAPGGHAPGEGHCGVAATLAAWRACVGSGIVAASGCVEVCSGAAAAVAGRRVSPRFNSTKLQFNEKLTGTNP